MDRSFAKQNRNRTAFFLTWHTLLASLAWHSLSPRMSRQWARSSGLDSCRCHQRMLQGVRRNHPGKAKPTVHPPASRRIDEILSFWKQFYPSGVAARECSLIIVGFFSKDFRIFRTLAFLCFPLVPVCTYTHQAGKPPSLQLDWQSSEKSKNLKKKKHII